MQDRVDRQFSRREAILALSAFAAAAAISACGKPDKPKPTQTSIIDSQVPTTSVAEEQSAQVINEEVATPVPEAKYPSSFSEIGINDKFLTQVYEIFENETSFLETQSPDLLEKYLITKKLYENILLSEYDADSRSLQMKIIINGSDVELVGFDYIKKIFYLPNNTNNNDQNGDLVEFQIIGSPMGFEECTPALCKTQSGRIVPLVTFSKTKEIVGWRDEFGTWKDIKDAELVSGIYSQAPETLNNRLQNEKLYLYDPSSGDLTEMPTRNLDVTNNLELINALTPGGNSPEPDERYVIRHRLSGGMVVDRGESNGFVVFANIPGFEQTVVAGAPYLESVPKMFTKNVNQDNGGTYPMYTPQSEGNPIFRKFGFAGKSQVGVFGTYALGQLHVVENDRSTVISNCEAIVPVDPEPVIIDQDKINTTMQKLNSLLTDMFSKVDLKPNNQDIDGKKRKFIVHVMQKTMEIAADSNDPKLIVASDILFYINQMGTEAFYLSTKDYLGNKVNGTAAWNANGNIYFTPLIMSDGEIIGGMSAIIHELGHSVQRGGGQSKNNEFATHYVQLATLEAWKNHFDEIFDKEALRYFGLEINNINIAISNLSNYLKSGKYPISTC